MLFGSNNNNAAANMDEEVEKRTSLPNQAQQNSQIHEQSPPQLESQNATASPMECVEERFEQEEEEHDAVEEAKNNQHSMEVEQDFKRKYEERRKDGMKIKENFELSFRQN